MKKNRAFTLVELLTVIAIIGVLASILIPTVTSVRRHVNKVRTRAQFNNYIMGYQGFKTEYGFYPKMGSDPEKFDIAGSENNDLFIQTLSGRTKEGEDMDNSEARRLNKRKIEFYTFNQSDFALETDEYAGQIVDAFGNPHIIIVIDHDLNGVIRSSMLPDATQDLNASVAVYSEADIESDFEEVKSWE